MSDLNAELDFYLNQLEGAISLNETMSDDIAGDVLDIARQELCAFCLAHRAALHVIEPGEYFLPANRVNQGFGSTRPVNAFSTETTVHASEAAPRPDSDAGR